MEKKKVTKKTTNKKVNKPVKKTTTTKKAVNKKKKKKGFTLIELLAVIIILGILMIIAIPSVTKYISDSRKSAYIDTAKNVIGAARNLVNEGQLGMYDTNTTYYIEASCIDSENAIKSPYDDFDKAYVVVTYDGKGYKYYWTSVDKAGQGIKDIVRYDKLNEDRLESDLTGDDIKTNRGVDGRGTIILITKRNNCNKEGSVDSEISISGETGRDVLEYPEGKEKDTLSVGDMVKIGNQEFHVVKINTTDNTITLFAHYNLNVGNYKKNDVPEGIQSPEIKGKYNKVGTYGMVPFSTTDYWTGKLGTIYQTDPLDSSYYYVYDSNSILYPYVEQYKEYLNSLGVNVKEARLPNRRDFYNISLNAIDFSETSFWYGVASSTSEGKLLTSINKSGYNLMSYNSPSTMGIRPIIVI